MPGLSFAEVGNADFTFRSIGLILKTKSGNELYIGFRPSHRGDSPSTNCRRPDFVGGQIPTYRMVERPKAIRMFLQWEESTARVKDGE
jgi:hypothetical protein